MIRFLLTVVIVVALSSDLTFASKNSKEYRGKYSKEANTASKESKIKKAPEPVVQKDDDYRPPKNYATSSERLFKMMKIQNIWQKGQKTLNEAKLKALFHDLKTQDKQEITFKKIKAQGKDKDGLQEAALRKQLSGIIERYGLTSSFPEHQVREGDEQQIDRMFKDKKLNKLWNKIEASGLDEKELKILKEELDHHQTKLDQYYAFVDHLDETREKTPDMENRLDHFLEDEVKNEKKGSKKGQNKPAADKDDKIETVRIKHLELKENFDSLAEKVRSKLNEKEFTDEKAIKLWNLAKKADFSKEELESLRGELHHFEHRIRKLNHFANEVELKDNPDEAKHLKNKVQDYERKVEKVHDELRGRIARRTEL